MPDSGVSDGNVITSSYIDTYLRQQVVAQGLSSSRPTGVEGRLLAETDTNDVVAYDGSAWIPIANWGAWKTYTPTITASTTSPTGWTTSGRYVQLGKTIIGTASFTYGAGTAASGTLRFEIPVTAQAAGYLIGDAILNDSGTVYTRTAYLAATTYVTLYSEGGVVVTNGTPFTFGASDTCTISFVYEAA